MILLMASKFWIALFAYLIVGLGLSAFAWLLVDFIEWVGNYLGDFGFMISLGLLVGLIMFVAFWFHLR